MLTLHLKPKKKRKKAEHKKERRKLTRAMVKNKASNFFLYILDKK
jgi:hypothetical protein